MINTANHLLHRNYRPDIDGLRAFAVLSVVAFHAFPSLLKGGFIGVDIFFVISGFLISNFIFENLDKGTFSFVDFYARRIRRIFPALLLVLIVSYILGWLTLLADEYKQLGKHIAGGASFVSNFVLWAEEIGYFDNSSEAKPLLHLWSLGVEEQFYIVYPILLWVAWWLRFNILTIILTVAIISFVLNIYGLKSDVTATFYSPQTRVWEFIVAGVLAWTTYSKPELMTSLKVRFSSSLSILLCRKVTGDSWENLSNLISFLGFILILFGIFGIEKGFGFPGAWALVPVMGTVLIILAGQQAWVNRKILSNRVVVWFGLISYPLYLWHWILLSFAHVVESEVPSSNMRIVVVLISIVFAWITFWLVERPLRAFDSNNIKASVLFVIMTFFGVVGFKTYQNDGLNFRIENFNEKNRIFLSQLVTPPDLLRNISCSDYFHDYPLGLCLLKDDHAPDTLLVGDSHALHYYTGLANVMQNNIAMLGAGWDTDPLNPLLGSCEDNNNLNCVRQKKIFMYMKNSEIKTIVLSYLDSRMESADSIIHLSDTLRYMTSLNKNVIFSLDIPHLPFDPKLCLEIRPFRIQSKVKNPCGYEKSIYMSQSQNYRDKISHVLKKFPDVKVFDPAMFMCDEQYCYAMRNGLLLYRNGGENPHLSNDGSDFLAQHLKSLIPD